MKSWKECITGQFGKKANKKWLVAALDIMLVDRNIKKSLLFDHWAVNIQDMDELLQNALTENLITSNISTLAVGLDIFIFKKSSFTPDIISDKFIEQKLTKLSYIFIDISKSINQPKIINYNDKNVSKTVTLFHDFIENKCGEKDRCYIDIDSCDDINPPCLFGLFLGYPAVYWYHRQESEDNCLSSVSLRLYQVLGELRSDNKYLDKNQCGREDGKNHLIFSFTVPENVDNSAHRHVHDWFTQWRASASWSEMFSRVWMSEEVRDPQAVCL